MSTRTKAKGKMKYQYDKELAHSTASLVSSSLDQISDTRIGYVDMTKFLQRLEDPANKELRRIKRSNIHLISTFRMAALEPEFA